MWLFYKGPDIVVFLISPVLKTQALGRTLVSCVHVSAIEGLHASIVNISLRFEFTTCAKSTHGFVFSHKLGLHEVSFIFLFTYKDTAFSTSYD
jgi:hypothetical protein